MNSKVERWKNGAVSGIIFMEAYKRDFLIGLFVCFALVRNFLPKLIGQF